MTLDWFKPAYSYTYVFSLTHGMAHEHDPLYVCIAENRERLATSKSSSKKFWGIDGFMTRRTVAIIVSLSKCIYCNNDTTDLQYSSITVL